MAKQRKTSESEYIRRLEIAMADPRTYSVVITFKDLILLISAIQLALRHPGYPAATKQHVVDLTMQMIAYIDRYHPGTGELLLQGFDKSYDK